MGQKLTIVATCSERKRPRPDLDLCVRSLRPANRQERVAEWNSRLESRRPVTALRDLYVGDGWGQVLELERLATSQGYDVDLWVASAGLGLCPASLVAPSYGATFDIGHVDSVEAERSETEHWWSLLRSRRSRPSLREIKTDGFVLVLSSSYARAMRSDLAELGQTGPRAILFGGEQAVPGLLRVPADRGLQEELRGTAVSLNARTAQSWMEVNSGGDLYGEEARAAFENWSQSRRTSPSYNRIRLSDGEVADWIAQLRRDEPGITKSPALRRLRDAGLACEQKRFGQIFDGCE